MYDNCHFAVCWGVCVWKPHRQPHVDPWIISYRYYSSACHLCRAMPGYCAWLNTLTPEPCCFSS